MSFTEHSEPATQAIPEPPLIHHVELAISYILRGGVLISITLILVGMGITFAHHPAYATHSQQLKTIPAIAQDFPHTIAEMWDSVSHFRGQGFVILGLLVLLATPVIRVAASIIAFTAQRDWIFVAITVTVLTILILSFVLGKTEGGG